MRENIEIFINSRSADDTKSAEDAILKLKNLIQRMNYLRQEIQRDQVYASPWMNLMATQDTMRTCNARCSSCNQKWIPGSEIFNSDRAKFFLNKAKKNKLKGVCLFCGQKLP
ncbi:MAG TPA: hypothetical protein V6D50_18455 [Chroococcales cyanobacterium]|jgi:hypothetical protein